MEKIKRNKMIVSFFLLPLLGSLFLGSGLIQAEDTGFISKDVPVDLVLVIDESGSMRTNDPEDLRVDAARLFIELNQILTENNRVSVAGFGETTNIYIEPTGVAMNKQGIMEAVSSIKSDQRYTDMKNALEEVKLMLDERTKKNHAVVIFLTDGDLGIDDIPIPEEIRGDDSGSREKPKPPSRGTDEDAGSSEDIKDDEDSSSEAADREDRLNQYLEDYKEELFKLCYEYQDDGIKIFPIAFTAEANTEILDEISRITGSRMWVSQTASDVRNVYLDIFKYITSTFISVIPQEGQEPRTGEIELADYIIKSAVIAVANEYSDNPLIELTPPTPDTGQEIMDIDGSSYSIKVIEAPQEGNWEYKIEGDLVLALDLADISLIDPLKAVYFMDSEVPLVLQLSHPGIGQESVSYSDFNITFNIGYPEGKNTGTLMLMDDGNGIDEKKDDGIFSYGFEGIDSPGEYIIEFTIEHLPTGASSLKKKVFTVTDYQPVKKELYLMIENNIIAGTPIVMHANLEDLSAGAFIYTVTDPSGNVISGELFDNGNPGNSDDINGDGIYSNIAEGFDTVGTYAIEVKASYNNAEGYELTQTSAAEINKEISIELFSNEIEADAGSMTVTADFRITSNHDSGLSLGIGDKYRDTDIIRSIELDNDMIQPGSEQDVKMTIYLKDSVQEGNNIVIVPLIVGGAHTRDIEVSFLFQKGFLELDLKTLVGLILIVLSIIPLIFLLYTIMNLKRLRIRLDNPRIIVESVIFVALFVAGLVVVFT